MINQFARYFGYLYCAIAVLGFIPGVNAMSMPEMGVAVGLSYGHLFGLFPVNVIHNIVHFVLGAWGVHVSVGSVDGARTYARWVAIIYAVLTVAGFIPGLNTLFGLTPLFGLDVYLHALSAIVAAYFGWGAPTTDTRRAT